MRDAIRQLLVDNVPEVSGRILEANADGASALKPFLVLQQGPDNRTSAGIPVDTAGDDPWLAALTSWTQLILPGWTVSRNAGPAKHDLTFYLWLYTACTSFTDVDALALKCVKTLESQNVTASDGTGFTCFYFGSEGSDSFRQEWNALCRGLKFGCVGFSRPSVTWKPASIEITDTGNAVYEVRKKFVAQVLGRTPNEQLEGISTIVQSLITAIKLSLDPGKKQYLRVVTPTGDFSQDINTAGQVTVTLARRTTRPAEEVPFIARVATAGAIKNETE